MTKILIVCLVILSYSFNYHIVYYSIYEDTTVKFTSGSVSEGWTTLSFTDSTWTDVTLPSTTTAVTGISYIILRLIQ